MEKTNKEINVSKLACAYFNYPGFLFFIVIQLNWVPRTELYNSRVSGTWI